MRQLEAADFPEVDAGNAKGDYDQGFYLLMSEDAKFSSQAVIDQLLTATKLEFEIDPQLKMNIEDPKGEYDLVLVLADQVSTTSKTVPQDSAADQTKEATPAASGQ